MSKKKMRRKKSSLQFLPSPSKTFLWIVGGLFLLFLLVLAGNSGWLTRAGAPLSPTNLRLGETVTITDLTRNEEQDPENRLEHSQAQLRAARSSDGLVMVTYHMDRSVRFFEGATGEVRVLWPTGITSQSLTRSCTATACEFTAALTSLPRNVQQFKVKAFFRRSTSTEVRTARVPFTLVNGAVTTSPSPISSSPASGTGTGNSGTPSPTNNPASPLPSPSVVVTPSPTTSPTNDTSDGDIGQIFTLRPNQTVTITTLANNKTDPQGRLSAVHARLEASLQGTNNLTLRFITDREVFFEKSYLVVKTVTAVGEGTRSGTPRCDDTGCQFTVNFVPNLGNSNDFRIKSTFTNRVGQGEVATGRLHFTLDNGLSHDNRGDGHRQGPVEGLGNFRYEETFTAGVLASPVHVKFFQGNRLVGEDDYQNAIGLGYDGGPDVRYYVSTDGNVFAWGTGSSIRVLYQSRATDIPFAHHGTPSGYAALGNRESTGFEQGTWATMPDGIGGFPVIISAISNRHYILRYTYAAKPTRSEDPRIDIYEDALLRVDPGQPLALLLRDAQSMTIGTRCTSLGTCFPPYTWSNQGFNAGAPSTRINQSTVWVPPLGKVSAYVDPGVNYNRYVIGYLRLGGQITTAPNGKIIQNSAVAEARVLDRLTGKLLDTMVADTRQGQQIPRRFQVRVTPVDGGRKVEVAINGKVEVTQIRDSDGSITAHQINQPYGGSGWIPFETECSFYIDSNRPGDCPGPRPPQGIGPISH